MMSRLEQVRLAMSGLIARLPVRLRILWLASVPAVALSIIGLTYWRGQDSATEAIERSRAFISFSGKATELSVHGLRLANAAAAYIRDPNEASEVAVREQVAKARAVAKTVAASAAQQGVAAQMTEAESALTRAVSSFAALVEAVTERGYDSRQGLRIEIAKAADEAEKLVTRGFGFTAAPTGITDLFDRMRSAERNFRLGQEEGQAAAFAQSLERVRRIVDSVLFDKGLAQDVQTALSRYSASFTKWRNNAAEINKATEMFSRDIEVLQDKTAEMSEIAEAGRAAADQARERIDASTAWFLALVILLAIPLTLLFSLMVGRTISRPLSVLAGTMGRLAQGDKAADVTLTAHRTEIGDMIRPSPCSARTPSSASGWRRRSATPSSSVSGAPRPSRTPSGASTTARP